MQKTHFFKHAIVISSCVGRVVTTWAWTVYRWKWEFLVWHESHSVFRARVDDFIITLLAADCNDCQPRQEVSCSCHELPQVATLLPLLWYIYTHAPEILMNLWKQKWRKYLLQTFSLLSLPLISESSHVIKIWWCLQAIKDNFAWWSIFVHSSTTHHHDDDSVLCHTSTEIGMGAFFKYGISLLNLMMIVTFVQPQSSKCT